MLRPAISNQVPLSGLVTELVETVSDNHINGHTSYDTTALLNA